MQVGMKPKHIPEGLYGDNPSGDRLWVTRTSFVINQKIAIIAAMIVTVKIPKPTNLPIIVCS
jgi:hypothetical protein